MSISKSKTRSLLVVSIYYLISFIASYLIVQLFEIKYMWIYILLWHLISTLFIYLFSIIHKNSSIYDPFWSVAPIPIVIFLSIHSTNNLLINLLIIIPIILWALRLTLNWIYSWNGLLHEDFRYIDLKDTTNGKAFITSDVGQHQMFAAQYYKFDEPRKWINSGGLGTMGFGLPSAMGVKFAYPDEDVVCVTGEGSIQMCIQELSTCMQYGLPVKIINLNNRALGMVKQWQDMQYGGRYSSILYEDSLPDFVKLAESYGHVGMKVEDISELEERMDECISMKDKLVFMDVYVDPEEHVYPMLEAGGNMSEMRVSKTKKTF